MFRLAALLLAASVAFADSPTKDEPKKDPPKAAAVTATVTLKALTVKDGMIVSTQAVPLQEVVQVPVTRIVNGQAVTTVVQQTVTKMVMQETKTKLKDLKATGTDGKEMSADEVEKKLKDGGTVVMHAGKVDAELRKVFKDGTVFLEQTPPELKPTPPGTGGPAPLPPPNPK